MMISVSEISELTSRFLRIEDAETRKQAFELVSVTCLSPLPASYTDPLLAKQPKLRKKLEAARAQPKASHGTMNSLVLAVLEANSSGSNTEIVAACVELFLVVVQAAATRRFLRALLLFHAAPTQAFPDLHMLLFQDERRGALSRFKHKFPITAQKFSVFQLFQEIPDQVPEILRTESGRVEVSVPGEFQNRKFLEISTNFRFAQDQRILVNGVAGRVLGQRENTVRVEISDQHEFSDQVELAVLSEASQAALARVELAEEILASINFRLPQEISDPLLGLSSNEDGVIETLAVEDGEIGNFLENLPGRVLFVCRKFSEKFPGVCVGVNEAAEVKKILARRSEILAAIGKPEISFSCQAAAHAGISEAENFRWLELVPDAKRRADALIGKFSRVVSVQTQKFPISFARLKELEPVFDTAVLEAADTEMDVALAASFPGIKRIVLLNGGATSERLTRLARCVS